MEERAKGHAALRSTIAKNQRLVSEIQGSMLDLDQLWAARKDALAKARGGENSGALYQVPGRPLLDSEQKDQRPNLLLIVDDDQDDFVLLERALKKVDADTPICWAQDAGEALETLERFSSAFQNICLVVDIQLPDRDGFELVEAIRAMELPSQLRFVFVTGNPNPQLRARALSSGADGFFVKPCRHADFVEIAYRLTELCGDPAHH